MPRTGPALDMHHSVGRILSKVVHCELVCTLQGLAEDDLAEQWIEALERWSETSTPSGPSACAARWHRAQILRPRDRVTRPSCRRRPACEELRACTSRARMAAERAGVDPTPCGDIAGAEEAVLAAHPAGWDQQPVLAPGRLAHGDVAAAAIHPRGPGPSRARPVEGATTERGFVGARLRSLHRSWFRSPDESLGFAAAAMIPAASGSPRTSWHGGGRAPPQVARDGVAGWRLGGRSSREPPAARRARSAVPRTQGGSSLSLPAAPAR